MNVVSIMAHQDDEMRCLGTMLKCRARGDRLSFIVVTDGSKGFVQRPSISREEAARIRNEEMTALAKKAGATYINLGEPDEFLYDTPQVRMKLIEAIRKIGAQLIFTHYHVDYNVDHTTVNTLVRQCTMQASLPVLPTASAPLEGPPAIFLCEATGVVDFPATHYVDITDFQAEKVRLLECHVSQDEAMRLVTGRGIGSLCEKLEAFRGDQVGCKFAECFAPMQARGAVKPYNVLP